MNSTAERLQSHLCLQNVWIYPQMSKNRWNSLFLMERMSDPPFQVKLLMFSVLVDIKRLFKPESRQMEPSVALPVINTVNKMEKNWKKTSVYSFKVYGSGNSWNIRQVLQEMFSRQVKVLICVTSGACEEFSQLISLLCCSLLGLFFFFFSPVQLEQKQMCCAAFMSHKTTLTLMLMEERSFHKWFQTE